jgi:hypothetical protein
MQNISTSPSNMSYSIAAAALNLRTHYEYGTTTSIMQDLQETFEYMANTETCVTAPQEADHYRRKQGSFSKDMAKKMAYDSNTSPGMFLIVPLHSSVLIRLCCSFFSLFHIATQWWGMFDGDTPTLQKLALRLVSQYCSSSGCERNWRTFTLIHTNVCNRLSY